MPVQSEFIEQAQEKLQEIVALCYEISTKSKADAFFDYSPHTRQISVIVYENGWNEDATIEDDAIEFDYPVYFGKGVFLDDRKTFDDGLEGLDKTISRLKLIKERIVEDKPNE